MAKKVAFVGFGAVQGTDAQRVANALGVEPVQQLGFFDSINDAAQFVVTKVDGKVTAITGSEVYVSAEASDDTISKARRIRSVGVAVNLDWEPFKNSPYSENALRSWIDDGEWSDDSANVDANTQFVMPSYVDDSEEPESYVDTQYAPVPASVPQADQNYGYDTNGEGAYAEQAAPQFEAPSDVAPLPIIPVDQGGYTSPDYSQDGYVQDGYANQNEEPQFDAGNYVPDYATNEVAAPDAPVYEEVPIFDGGVPTPAEEPRYELEDSQEQSAAPVPMASFLTAGPIPVQEETPYESNDGYSNDGYAQQPVPEYNPGNEYASQDYAQQETPDYNQYTAVPEEPSYDAPQYGNDGYADANSYPQEPQEYVDYNQLPEPSYEQQQEPQSYTTPEPTPVPQYVPEERPASAPSVGGYTAPTPGSSFIQQSPTPAPPTSQYQRERSMFDQVPAGANNDFESRTGGKIVYVTGSHGGAGKTTTAWTLASLVAVSMKKAGNEDISVWLIESDYRNSKLAQRHNIDPNRTSGHLASMLEWLNDQSGIVDDLPAKKAHAIAQSTHRLENGLNIIACPYDTTKRDTKYIQQAVFQAAQYAKMQGGIVFIDADTISNDDIMDSKLAKAADRVVIVSDAGTEHIDDLKRAARILTTPVINGGLGVSMPAITVLLNKTGPTEFKNVEDSGILAPLALGGYLPFIPEWATGWVGSLTNTETFQNAVVLFARFFNGIVPLQELHQWQNYRATGTSKKGGGGWIRRIFSGRK